MAEKGLMLIHRASRGRRSGKVHRVGMDSRKLEDETMAFSVDASSEPVVSPEEAVSSLRELREALGRALAPRNPFDHEPSPVLTKVDDPNFTQTVLSNSDPGRSMAQILRERNEASQRLSEIRMRREARFNRPRIGVNTPRVQEKEGVLASLKKLLSGRSKKK